MKISRSGFTIVELMISSLLFSMVIAALAAIYATAFGQSGRVFREGRTKMMANMSMRSIMREVAQSTRIDLPAKNSAGTQLSGCTNAKSNSTRITTAEPSIRFHFCVRATNRATGQPCDGDPDVAPCLFYYSRSVAGSCVASDVTSASCGNNAAVMGVPQLLASGLEVGTGMPGNIYFTRMGGATHKSDEDNAVRVSYKVTRPPFNNMPKLVYEVDTTASGHFGVRP